MDGQHRVEGIKKALINDESHADETIPVIFIGHKNDSEGKKRTRRLFSTLNRYAKPVSLTDIIALDEDDAVAIATRYIIENVRLFEKGRLLLSLNKAISPNENRAFTNIQVLYECNKELLKYFISKNSLTPKSLNEFCKFRRNQNEVNLFNDFVKTFWEKCVSRVQCINDYMNISIQQNPAQQFRHNDGGNLLFRPIGQVPFVKTAIALYNKFENWDLALEKMASLNYDLSSDLWINVAWDNAINRMIISYQKLIELLMKFCIDESLLSNTNRAKMVQEYKSAKQLAEEGDDHIISLISAFKIIDEE